MFDSVKKELSRRALLYKAGFGFMGLSVVGAVGNIIKPAPTLAQAAPAPSNEPSLPPEKKLGWAIVGLGEFATKQIMPSFAECKKSKLVALVSGDRAKAEKYAQQYSVNPKNIYNYQNYDSIRNNPEVDIIYIILPNALHAEYSIRGVQAGKHIMCEKPMAITVAECQAMIEAAKKANRKLMIAYRAQYEPYNLATIQLAQSGKLGKLKLITSDHGRNLNPKEPQDRWRAQKKLAGGGSLYDIGIYSLQAARYITGEEPVAISAMIYSTPNDPRFREVEENVNFVLRFPSGVLANCSSSYGYSNTKRIQVFGSDAVLELDPATDYYKHRLILKSKNGNQEQKIEDKNQFALEIDHLSESIIQNKQPKTPGEEGLQDVKLMQLIYEAARTGKSIKV
ncbi:glucose-fructose oxidoreductase [Brasilonema octagenarum UFV-E1]|uniref:Glucose-fructose oxidoreductase n=1 Tax=Brasilonema sennae CENA114 TaxID=415709 RepID=A0A856MKI7_9CYAN|nr:Gfo/Idh/MocA family oxidoreductase [Brasilonema sennae]QDL10644.1 glucose-fructose oxidoreductase [Brasilonema sennae CENA114]QDL16991.1 glucose-fructose oxidoreductase [Brasilonema octagenarum UFV-E1]